MIPTYDMLIAGSGLPRLESRILLEHASGRCREWLIAHGDEQASAALANAFAGLVRRRQAGKPLAYLLGWREFHGRRFEVTPEVLIPRADTELAVRWACAQAPQGARVLELGTGSGAIAISLALERTDLEVLATDLSAAALEVARRNALALGADSLVFRLGDWYGPLRDDERFELIVANPPYIAPDDPHLVQGDLPHEPRHALTDGHDGLQALRSLAAGAMERLSNGGWIGLEHGWDQGAAVRTLLIGAGLEEVRTLADDEHRDRLSIGRRPARTPASASREGSDST